MSGVQTQSIGSNFELQNILADIGHNVENDIGHNAENDRIFLVKASVRKTVNSIEFTLFTVDSSL